MVTSEDAMEIVLHRDLEKQISNAIDSRFLLQLVCYRDFPFLYETLTDLTLLK